MISSGLLQPKRAHDHSSKQSEQTGIVADML